MSTYRGNCGVSGFGFEIPITPQIKKKTICVHKNVTQIFIVHPALHECTHESLSNLSCGHEMTLGIQYFVPP